jgi:aconitate hydratase
MIGAGILAKKAVEKGLRVKPYVKSSLAPGSGVVLDYLGKSGLLNSLENLGFFTVGIGCTTCIGNSGPLHPEIERVVNKDGLIFTSVLSGNRNFEARIHQNVKANYLASPALVVAFAIAGRTDIDLTTEPLGTGIDGKQVYVSDIWPSHEEVSEIMNSMLTPDIFKERYRNAIEGDSHWKSLPSPEGKSFKWNKNSTYIKSPPFFRGFKLFPDKRDDIDRARALLLLGDSVTTDHISPAGAIPGDYPAGQYLISENVSPLEFNTYGSRRGNHEVMLRGTFANVRIKNMLVAPKEGGFTKIYPDGDEDFTYNAAMRYMRESRPLVVIAGKEYGTGSSRDWAAKGTHLLGVRAVIAESYERIHRSNLVGMGVLPLQFSNGTNWKSLGLDGGEEFCIYGINDIAPGMSVNVDATKENGDKVSFEVTVRLDTAIEVEYYNNDGILPFVLRMLAKE